MNNFAMLKGNVGKDPEVRTTQSGIKVATYSIAVYRPNPQDKEKPIADWFNVIAWRDQADIAVENIKKGSKVLVTGKFQTRSYQDKDGKTVYATDFVQDELFLAPGKHNDTGSIHGDELPF